MQQALGGMDELYQAARVQANVMDEKLTFGDYDLFDAYVAFGTNKYTLAYALGELKAVSQTST